MKRQRGGRVSFVVSTCDSSSPLFRFRWVQCQLDILKRCATGQELREALDNLPTELETTYERILDAIDERRWEGKLARRALAWLVVALEPLHLRQIVDGLSADLLLPRRMDREIRLSGTALLDALSSLVSYHKETDVVALSHFSVKVRINVHSHPPCPRSLIRRNSSVAVRHFQRTRSSRMWRTLRQRKGACATYLLS